MSKHYSPQQIALYSYLIERVCAEEWHKTITHKTGVNSAHTLVPFVPSKLKRKVSADSGIGSMGLSNDSGTADGQTAIYWLIAQRMPVAEYFWDDEIFMKTFQSVDFDFLAFCNFYISNSYKLAAEVWGFGDPITLDFRHAIQKNESQFSLSKKMKNAPVDPERAKKHELFTKYWKRTFHDMMLANEARKKMIPIAGEEIHWQIIRNAPTLDDLEPVYKNGLDSIIAAIAVTVDNMLENEERFRRAERLKRKIPETWLIYSLKVVPNPTPFVQMAIPLFVKKIPGFGVSLFQLFGSSLVGYSRTNAQRKNLDKKIPKDRQEMIDRIIASSGMDVLATPKIIKATLSKKMGDVSKEEIAYARFTIRLAEKKDFIDYLGQGNITFDFIAKIMPPIMREFMKYYSLSNFLQDLFELLQECLNALRANFEPTKDKTAMKKKIISDLIFSITKFVKMMYAQMHKMAKHVNTSKEPKTLIWLFDMLLNLVFELCDLPLDGLKGFHTKIQSSLSQMSPKDQKDAIKFADAILQMSNQGVDERFWPRSPVVDSLVAEANQELRKMVLNMNVLNTVERIHKDEALKKIQLKRK